MRERLAAFATLVLVGAAACGGAGDGDRTTAAGAPSASERRDMHDGLDRIGRACARRARGARARQVAADEVGRLLTYRRRYPTQRFALERGGESGTMLSVLLVARAELLGCAPSAVEAVDRVLPPSVRKALPPARTAPSR